MIFYTYESGLSGLGTGCITCRRLQNLQPHTKRNINKTATLGVLLFFFCDTAIPSFWHKILHLLLDRHQNSTWNRVKGTAEELIVIRHHHGPRSISRKSWKNGLIMRLIDEQWCAQPQLNMFIQSSNVLRQTKVSHGFAVDYVLTRPGHFHVGNCKSMDHWSDCWVCRICDTRMNFQVAGL